MSCCGHICTFSSELKACVTLFKMSLSQLEACFFFFCASFTLFYLLSYLVVGCAHRLEILTTAVHGWFSFEV